MIYVLRQNSLALERMKSNFNETTAILKHHDGILQETIKAVQRGNKMYSAILVPLEYK